MISNGRRPDRTRPRAGGGSVPRRLRPGGQNANKVATNVQLRVNAYKLRLSPEVFARLQAVAGQPADRERRHPCYGQRTPHAGGEPNRGAGEAGALLEEAQRQPKRRAKTRLNRVGKTERLATKKARGAVKAGRGKVEPN
jgi:ribosome-associated protein